LVYQANGGEVDTTIVAGRVLMEDGRFTEISEDDERKTLGAAQEASVRIAERAGMRWRTERGWPTLSV
jgi:cytosine/adenosine deaminase-related metal-dependent hydrolase